MAHKPTSQQLAFAKHYAKTGDALESYKQAYPERADQVEKRTVNVTQLKLSNPKVKSFIEEIQQGLRAQFVLLAPEALENLVELANHAENERVRLDANREILYGAGLKPPEQIELREVSLFGNASLEEVRSLLRMRLEEATKEPVVDAEVSYEN